MDCSGAHFLQKCTPLALRIFLTHTSQNKIGSHVHTVAANSLATSCPSSIKRAGYPLER